MGNLHQEMVNIKKIYRKLTMKITMNKSLKIINQISWKIKKSFLKTKQSIFCEITTNIG